MFWPEPGGRALAETGGELKTSKFFEDLRVASEESVSPEAGARESGRDGSRMSPAIMFADLELWSWFGRQHRGVEEEMKN